jgi:predicted MFS family arabinose efflux permease
MPPGVKILLAVASGLIVANIYYAQPLIGPIGASLKLPTQAAGLIVTLMQMGYGAGLLLIVPLADRVENRRLALAAIGLAGVGLLGAALSPQTTPFLVCALLIGLGSVAVQVLLPLAAHMAPAASRGRVVGDVSMGLMLGIMLARPVASFIAGNSSWRTVFFAATIGMVAVAGGLAVALPKRQPATRMPYGALLASMIRLGLATPVLRSRALYQSCLFAAFSLFWTTTPLLLAEEFHFTQHGIALFALAGVSGAIAAPIAGRIADRGYSRLATGFAILAVAAAFLVTDLAPSGSPLALALLVGAAILIDFGVQTNAVLGFRAIFALGGESRGRLNGLYIAIYFVVGAVGSGVGAWAYARGGWGLASAFGLAFPTIALIFFAIELRRSDRRRTQPRRRSRGP